MTKQNVMAMRDLAMANDFPMIVICDNEHYFIDNSKDTFAINWDDDNETMTVLQPAAVTGEFYTQSVLPFRLVRTEYDHIQFIELAITKLEAINQLTSMKNGGKITDDQYKADLDLLSRAAAVSTIPNTRK